MSGVRKKVEIHHGIKKIRRKRMIKRIHVNQHKIRHNLKHGSDDPVITVKTSKSNEYGHEVLIHGMAKVIYSPDKPLSCGAKVWIETESEVEVKNVCMETSKIL
jgi:hypothetical protein